MVIFKGECRVIIFVGNVRLDTYLKFKYIHLLFFPTMVSRENNTPLASILTNLSSFFNNYTSKGSNQRNWVRILLNSADSKLCFLQIVSNLVDVPMSNQVFRDQLGYTHLPYIIDSSLFYVHFVQHMFIKNCWYILFYYLFYKCILQCSV